MPPNHASPLRYSSDADRASWKRRSTWPTQSRIFRHVRFQRKHAPFLQTRPRASPSRPKRFAPPRRRKSASAGRACQQSSREAGLPAGNGPAAARALAGWQEIRCGPAQSVRCSKRWRARPARRHEFGAHVAPWPGDPVEGRYRSRAAPPRTPDRSETLYCRPVPRGSVCSHRS